MTGKNDTISSGGFKPQTTNVQQTYKFSKEMEPHAFGWMTTMNGVGTSMSFIDSILNQSLNFGIAGEKYKLEGKKLDLNWNVMKAALDSKDTIARLGKDVAIYSLDTQKSIAVITENTKLQIEYIREKEKTRRAMALALDSHFRPTKLRSNYYYG